MNVDINLLEILSAGGRLTNERSHAAPARHYFDPVRTIKFSRGAMEKTKAIEQILYYEIENWLRWGRNRNWMPVSFRTPLGYLFKSSDVHEASVRRPEVKEGDAANFERIIIALPEKHRQAFVMYHLERAIVNGKVISIKGRGQAQHILGLQKSRYHEVVNQAHSIVLRECQRLKLVFTQDD
jgi:hypothetical protein